MWHTVALAAATVVCYKYIIQHPSTRSARPMHAIYVMHTFSKTVGDELRMARALDDADGSHSLLLQCLFCHDDQHQHQVLSVVMIV